MYIVDVRPVSDILPRIFAIDFNPQPADFGATPIVLTAAPEAALEKTFQFFPKYLGEGCRAHIGEIEYAVIGWETDQVFGIQRRGCRSKLRE
jgi:hypothetical protein